MSEIITDKLTGKTTAKTVTVTVGASATQSLEQGLAKHWTNVDQTTSTPIIEDSFNNSSVTDSGTGDYSPVFVNNMSNANYAVALCCGDSGARFHGDVVNKSSVTASTYRTYWVNTTNAAVNDNSIATTTVHGDLA